MDLYSDDAEDDVAFVGDDDLTDVVHVSPQSLASRRLLLLRRSKSLHSPLFSPISVTRTRSRHLSLSFLFRSLSPTHLYFSHAVYISLGSFRTTLFVGLLGSFVFVCLSVQRESDRISSARLIGSVCLAVVCLLVTLKGRSRLCLPLAARRSLSEPPCGRARCRAQMP